MKLHIMSDLHLEFYKEDSPPEFEAADADVLVLAGDIIVADHLDRSATSPYSKFSQKVYDHFFKWAKDNYKHVVMVLGNHEHYHGDIVRTPTLIRNRYDIHLLDDECIVLDGVKFFGGTLWTDFRGGNPLDMYTAGNSMNDYRIIRQGHFKLKPLDTLARHKRTLLALKESNADIIVTHHAPSYMSIHERYRNDVLNSSYASEIDFTCITSKLWIHGHTHNSFDYQIYDTRVVCNPYGYRGTDLNSEFDALKVIEYV